MKIIENFGIILNNRIKIEDHSPFLYHRFIKEKESWAIYFKYSHSDHEEGLQTVKLFQLYPVILN